MDGDLPKVLTPTRIRERAARLWRRPAILIGAGGTLAVVLILGLWTALGPSRAPSVTAGETARAVRDRLVVTIVESGEIDAKRSTDVRCEVEGQNPIVWIIEEGTVVKPGDKLVELDSADLRERLRSQEMAYKTAQAASEKSDKQYLITESTRESLMAAAGLDVKFTLQDLRRYLGKDLADRLITQEGKMAFDALIREDTLGGAALQEKRKLESDIDLAQEELSRATGKAEWTRTLKEKGYVTGSELQADELALKRQQVLLGQAKTALDLFLQYEFPKTAEKSYTDWLEAQREYDRVDTRTRSEVGSARADRDNKREALSLEENRLKKGRDQVEKTVIRAPQPGMVVYDTGGGRWGQNPTLEPGVTVRHQQTLIKLPDMSEMSVKAKLHESVVKQAGEGAPAYVTIDALPKERLSGKVTKVAVMPDRSNSWLNPGLKTYLTEITLDSTPPGLKPGMSAQVEILVDSRDRALQVPVSAVFVDKGFQVVYIRTSSGCETRRVEVGLSNDRAVEIVKGLEEGEEVFLYKPAGAEELQVSEEETKAREALERKMMDHPKPAGGGSADEPSAANSPLGAEPARRQPKGGGPS